MTRAHQLAKILSLAALCATFTSGEILWADTASYSTPIPASDAGTPPGTASFSLPEFNPALGTLTGVEVDFTLNYQGEVDVANFSGFAQTFTASSTVPIMMDTPSNPSLGLVNAAYSLSSSVGSAPAEYPFPGPVLNTTVPYDPPALDFPDYEGVGSNSYTLSYGLGTYTGTDNTGDPGVFFGGDANSSGSAEVTYTYTAVPEPSTLVLLALGAIGLAVVSARRAFPTGFAGAC